MSQGNFLPGELTVDAIILINPEGEMIDLTSITPQIDIFESITESFLHGRISVVDALGIADDYKIVGQESLTIKYRVKEDGENFSKQIEKVFRIYKITNVQNDNFETYGYAIHFIDPKFFVCENTRISKVLRGSYSEMLLQTLSKDAKFDKLPQKGGVDFWDTSTPSNHQLVCPNWSINEFISYIVKTANHETNPVFKNSMFFFQTMIGGFRFMSLDKMLDGNNELISKFDYKPRSTDLTQEDIPTEADAGQSSRIISFEIQKKSDTLRGTTRGAYSSNLKTYDPIRKIEKEIYFDLAENFKRNKDKHLSGFPPIRLEDNEVVLEGEAGLGDRANVSGKEREVDFAPNKNYLRGAKTHYAVNPTNAYSDSPILNDTSQYIGNENLDNAILERESMLELLSQNMLKVTIPYRQDVSVGSIINITLPAGKPEGETNALNDNRYLITKARHQIAPLEYRGTMTLQCVKESLAADIKEIGALDKYEGGIDDE
jgi:hypothetical protein